MGQLWCCEDIRAVSSVLVALLHQMVALPGMVRTQG